MKRQKGATLIELMLTLSLMGVVTMSVFAERSGEMDVAMAKGLGTRFVEYNNAVQSFIADNPNATYPMSRTGTAWLKHTSCTGGSSAKGYLPCDFPSFSFEGTARMTDVAISTTLTKQTISGETFIRANTETTPIRHNNVRRPDLAGVSALVAASSRSDASSPSPVLSGSSFGSNPTTGRVTMVASSQRSYDGWLRTDGSNRMLNNIVFDPSLAAGNREVTGVSTVKGRGSETLSIQTSNNNSALEVASNKAAARSGSSLFEITPTRSLTRVGTTSTEISSGTITHTAGTTSRRINSTGVLDKAGTLASSEVRSGNIINKVGANSDEISSAHAMTRGSRQVTGVLNAGASGETNFSSLKSSGTALNVTGNAAMDAVILLDGNINMPGTLQAGGLLAKRFISKGGLTVEPHANSTFNNLLIYEHMLFTKTYARGSSCSNKKQVGRSNSGELMFCNGSVWKQVKYE